MGELLYLNDDKLRLRAPSIFAESPYCGVSERYSFIPTNLIVDALRENHWMPFYAKEAPTRKVEKEGFSKHLIKFRRDEYQDLDYVPEILLYNSHDAGSSFQFYVGIYRYVCANGLVVGDHVIPPVRVRHVGKVIDEAIIGVDMLSKRIPDALAIMDKMIKFIPTHDQIYSLKKFAISERFGVDKVSVSERFFYPRREVDTMSDLWTRFNVVQESVIRGGRQVFFHDKKRWTTARPVKSIDENLRINRHLWDYAAKMAA